MEREIILSEQQIHDICKDIACKLDTRFEADGVKTPIVIGVLKGSVNFMMDLIREMKTEVMTDYIQVSSYSGTASTGAVILKKDLSLDITGKSIVIVEDVIDTGLTMQYLTGYLKEHHNPKEIIIVSLFDKLYLRKTDLHVDYTGKMLTENKFLVGYGLDYNEISRNVPYVYVAQSEDIKHWDELLKGIK
ncbi:MAG: hypoxanthine phosphoribosyltransferase [Bacilli bacterium]|nr:hypoxanthine phosphoribosyltransferase [Bacilli bacterium]